MCGILSIHMIIEARDKTALSRGMQTLSSCIARAANRATGNKGKLFAERYHARTLRSPLEVRRAILYVLRNSHHHERARGFYLPPWHFDECSSILEFEGFSDHPEFPPPPLIAKRTTVAPLYSYLLRTGWKKHGLIGLTEIPS